MVTTRSELINSLKEHCQGRDYICITELATYLAIYRGTASKMLRGLDYIKVGKQKKFPLKDVAEMLIELKRLH